MNSEKNSTVVNNESVSEELNDLIMQYNTAINYYEQASAVDPALYRGGTIFSSPANYCKIYAEINDQTPIDEARIKSSRIQKAVDIEELSRQKSTYTEEEMHKYAEELVMYFCNNEDQYDLYQGILNGQDRYPDGRKIKDFYGFITDYDVDQGELFWNLKNDTMSIGAWAFFRNNGTTIKSETEDRCDYDLFPELLNYRDELSERHRRQEREQKRTSRPDIYDPRPDDVYSSVYSCVKNVDFNIIEKIILDTREHYNICYSKIIAYLSDFFKLEDTPHFICKTKNQWGRLGGDYRHESGLITVYRGDYPYKKDLTVDELCTIVHEMWHAYQHSVVDKNREDLGSELYRENFNDYISPSEDYDAYRKQLAEAEAYLFESYFFECFNHSLISVKNRKLGSKALEKVRTFLASK